MKTVTHLYAVGAAAVMGFLMTSAGQALLMQYPKAASLVAALTTVLALYHNPKAAKVVALLILGLALCGTGYAQTTPGQTTPQGEPFTVTGNYSASTSNSVKNGVESTFEYSIAPRWQLRIDEITDLNGNLINLGEGQFKIPINRIFKTAPPSFANILLGIHSGLGAVKAPSGSVSFGLGAGFSVDYQVNSMFFVRVMNLTDVYSRGLTPTTELFGNYNNVNVGAGIGFSF